METINAELNEKFKNFADKLLPAGEIISDSAERIADVPETIEKLIAQMSELPAKIKTVHETLSESYSYIEGKLSETTIELNKSVSMITASNNAAMEAVEEIKKEMSSVIRKSEISEAEIAKNLQAAVGYHNQIIGETKSVLSGYLQVDKSLKSIFDQMSQQLSTYFDGIVKNLNKIMDGFSQGAKNYSAGFSASFEEIRNSVSEIISIQDGMERSEKSVQSILQEMKSLQDSIHDSVLSLNGSLEQKNSAGA